MQKSELIHQLKSLTKQHLTRISELKQLSQETLNKQSNEKSWSINQCIEHLSRYADYYIPALEKAIKKAKVSKINEEYKSGWLGNYFAESMLPESLKSKPMSTFKSMNPFDGKIRPDVINKFEARLNQLLNILEMSEQKNLSSPRIPTTLSTLIQLKAGDTFRFVINHHERHIQQAFRMLNK